MVLRQARADDLTSMRWNLFEPVVPMRPKLSQWPKAPPWRCLEARSRSRLASDCGGGGGGTVASRSRSLEASLLAVVAQNGSAQRTL